MSGDLFQLVGEDLNRLGDLIARSRSSSVALQGAKRLFRSIEQAGAAVVLDQIRPGDTET